MWVQFPPGTSIFCNNDREISIRFSASGRIDHYSFASDDIESDYAYCVKNGYKIDTDGIEGIAGFWDNGIRYFKIASPTGEQFEFCQIL